MSQVEDLKRALSSWAPGDPPSATWFLPELRKLLRAQFAGCYRPSATDTGWSLDFMHGAGDGASAYSRIFRNYVARLPPSDTFLALSNPHLVQAEQRNQVMSMGEIARLQNLGDQGEPFHTLFRALGIAGHDQIRVLVCDGPRQLAWVGATREAPFTERETALLRRLRRPLRERLRLERQLTAPGLLSNALDAALEALRTAAFVIGPHRTVEFANPMGLVLLEGDRRAVLDAIRESELRGPHAGAFWITRLGGPGWPGYVLAIKKTSSEGIERVLLAQRRWGLSVRQARVLELVTTGASNKEIASALGCAEATIESHLTELFRRSGATSRAGLVGKLFDIA